MFEGCVKAGGENTCYAYLEIPTSRVGYFVATFFRSHFLGGRRHSCKYGTFKNVSRRELREVIPSNVGRGLLERYSLV